MVPPMLLMHIRSTYWMKHSTITSRAFLRIVNSAAATALGRPDAATGASPQHHN